MIDYYKSIFSNKCELKCNNERLNIDYLSNKTLFKGVKANFIHRELFYSVDLTKEILLKYSIKKNDDINDFQLQWNLDKEKRITCENYTLITEKRFNRLVVRSYYKEQEIFILSGYNNLLGIFMKLA